VIVAGVLSGTSLDGIDVAIVDVRPRGSGYRLDTLAFATVPFAEGLRERLLAAFPPAPLDALAFSALHADVGAAFGAAIAAVAAGRRLDLVGSHGITLAHDGARAHTLQIGDAFRIREAAGCSVAYDFRSADTAAGGQGAPLVPHVDALLLADDGEDRVALNLGGIANLTVLPAGAPAPDLVAFDSGPANLPIDTYVRIRSGGAQRFDRDGGLARAGRVDESLLATFLRDPYFAQPPPKSTGRERFGDPFVAHHRAALDALAFSDAVATLTALSAQSVAAAIAAHAPPGARVIASGGGAHNPALLAAIAAALPGSPLASSSAYGIDPDAKEALAFAVLAYELVRGRAAGRPSVTGARGARLLGALAPVDLEGLVMRMHEDLARSGTLA
jgi:anhydro-N-acetylmuramic acid kinase